jgi:FAD:protein FMN transferase
MSREQAGPAVERRADGATWTALGCTVHVLVTDPDAVTEAAALLAAEVDALDLACSRFRDDSELAAVNAAGGRVTPIGPVLTGAIRASLDAAQATSGDVDPTVATALSDLGYDRDFAALPADGPVARVRMIRAPHWSLVELDENAGTVRLPESVALDLGATAKAWCADRSAGILASRLGCGVLVALGGDIAVAGAVPGGGWTVRVQEQPGPVEAAPAGSSCVIGLTGGGLATSSTTARRWRRGGRLLHHIVDPRTNMPAVGQWRTVSVAAPTCLEANVQSTAAIVRSAAALDRLASSGLAAWLVSGDGAVTTVNGWPSVVAA